MWFAKNATVTTMSSKPCFASRRTMCSIIGAFAIGIMGFGWLLVSGRSRVPSPPARMTAFIGVPSSGVHHARPPGPTLAQRLARDGDVPGRGVVAQDQPADREAPGDHGQHVVADTGRG